jgi:Family of unknown function (DUF5678)
MNAKDFLQNVSAHTVEQLGPFANRHVAWSEDGKRVLTHAATLEELYREIDRLGYKQYVVGFVPAAEDTDLGGGQL